MNLDSLIAWAKDHAAAMWPVLSALLIVALRSRTPEGWVALGEKSPRLQGVIKALRGAGFDPVKVVAGLAQAITGRAPARAAQIADTIAPPAPKGGA